MKNFESVGARRWQTSPARSFRKIDPHRPSFVAVRIVRRALYNSAGHATRSTIGPKI